MKKPRKAILTLAAITALFSAGGCDQNSIPCVYGPPPDDYQPQQTVTQTYPQSTTEFDPAENIPEEVYGPPVDFGDPVESCESAESSETSDTAETDDTTDTAEV